MTVACAQPEPHPPIMGKAEEPLVVVNAKGSAGCTEATVPAYPVADGRCPHCGSVTPPWPAALVLAAFRAWAERTGRPPKADEWQKSAYDHPARSTPEGMFGSWSRAMTAAGFEPRKGPDVYWTRERIVDALTAWGAEHGGRPPRCRDWWRQGRDRPTARCVIDHFGTWNAALDAAGFFPRGPYGVILKAKEAA